MTPAPGRPPPGCQRAGHCRHGPADMRLVTDVCGPRFERANLSDRLVSIRERSGRPPQRLDFGTTERALLQRADALLAIFRRAARARRAPRPGRLRHG